MQEWSHDFNERYIPGKYRLVRVVAELYLELQVAVVRASNLAIHLHDSYGIE